jgi:2-polyprenyl-3-methyl-5-hydroxy-6-metoxy-1,4-benzoquinol methylase
MTPGKGLAARRRPPCETQVTAMAGSLFRTIGRWFRDPEPLEQRLGALQHTLDQTAAGVEEAAAALADKAVRAVAQDGTQTRNAVTHEASRSIEQLQAAIYRIVSEEGTHVRAGVGETVAAARDLLAGLIAEHGAREAVAHEAVRVIEQVGASTYRIVSEEGTHVRAGVGETVAAARDLLAGLIAEHGVRVQEAAAAAANQNLLVAAEVRDRIASWGVDYFKLRELEGLLRYQRRRQYLDDIRTGRLDVPTLATDHPVAVESDDSRFPHGAKNDNTIAPRFNRKLYQLFPGKAPIRVLDLGCAGGGLVRSLIDDGHLAVGLEGSDYPLENQTGEWATIPHHLFTCDVTKPFTLTRTGTDEVLEFDAITAWEVMEHIPEAGLDGMLDNVRRHLAPDGWVLLSIATVPDGDPKTGAVWHVTVKPREWWEARFRAAGFEPTDDHPFGMRDWARGSGQARFDWDEDMGIGFHLALRRAKGD